MRITLYRTRIGKPIIGDKLLQYDTKHKRYVIRFKIDSIHAGGLRYTVANNLKQAIKLLKDGYRAGKFTN